VVRCIECVECGWTGQSLGDCKVKYDMEDINKKLEKDIERKKKALEVLQKLKETFTETLIFDMLLWEEFKKLIEESPDEAP